MKTLEIKNSNTTIGYLFYYENSKQFYIELKNNLNEWDAPLLLSSFVSRGIFSINSYWSKLWVKQRIIPSERQNIGQILKDNKLSEYDEYKMLMLANGRCAQDDFYLEETDLNSLPKHITKRFQYKLEDTILSNNSFICFFRNGEVKRVYCKDLIDSRNNFNTIIDKPNILSRFEIQTDGYGIMWDENIFVDAYTLYLKGKLIDIELNDFICFVQTRVINTSQACKILDCSRQNINDLIKRDKLHPIRNDDKNILFNRNEIIQRKKNT